MKYLSLFVLAVLSLNLVLVESADAQNRRREPRYDRNPPGQHRPGPGYENPRRPRPRPDYDRPAPRPTPYPYPTPGYGYPTPPRPTPYPYPTPGYGQPSPGRVTCSATDRGWEEHWGGHGSCGSCLQEHGNCTETCKETTQLCEVQGTDYYGNLAIYRAVGVDRWSAESEARRKCEWNRDMRSCVTISCQSQDRVVSTRSCR